MSVQRAIRRAERVLPGKPVPEGKKDPRWQAMIMIGCFIETDPDPVWEFVNKWGRHDNPDLRTGVGTVLLEHLLEHHFAMIFPRVQEAVRQSKRFSDTFNNCWKFGQAKEPNNARRFNRLQKQCGRRHDNQRMK